MTLPSIFKVMRSLFDSLTDTPLENLPGRLIGSNVTVMAPVWFGIMGLRENVGVVHPQLADTSRMTMGESVMLVNEKMWLTSPPSSLMSPKFQLCSLNFKVFESAICSVS